MKRYCLLFLCLNLCSLLFANSYAAIQFSKNESYVLKIESSLANLYCVKADELSKVFISGLNSKKYTAVHSFLSSDYSGFILSNENLKQCNEFSLLYKASGNEFRLLSFSIKTFYDSIEFYYLTEGILNVFFRAGEKLVLVKTNIEEEAVISTETVFESSEFCAFNVYKGKLLVTSLSSDTISFFYELNKVYEFVLPDPAAAECFKLSVVDEKIYLFLFNTDDSFEMYKAEYDSKFAVEKICSSAFDELDVNQILDFSFVTDLDFHEVFYVKYQSKNDSPENTAFVLFTNEKVLYKSEEGFDCYISCLEEDNCVFFLSRENGLEEIKFEITCNKYFISTQNFESKDDFIYLSPVFYKYKLPLFYDVKQSNLVFFETRKNEYFYKPLKIQNNFSLNEGSGFIQSNFFNGKSFLFFPNENQIVSLEY